MHCSAVAMAIPSQPLTLSRDKLFETVLNMRTDEIRSSCPHGSQYSQRWQNFSPNLERIFSKTFKKTAVDKVSTAVLSMQRHSWRCTGCIDFRIRSDCDLRPRMPGPRTCSSWSSQALSFFPLSLYFLLSISVSPALIDAQVGCC